jgi:hypothetical protein
MMTMTMSDDGNRNGNLATAGLARAVARMSLETRII